MNPLIRKPWPLLAGVSVLAGCAFDPAGLGGSSTFSCKAPEGVRCQSVSGTYYNAIANNLPSQQRPKGAAPSGPTQAAPRAVPAGTSEEQAAPPLRSAPKVLRLWIKPWEDADGDLNGESLTWIQVDNGQWQVDRVQQKAREPFAPQRAARPPAATTASKPAADTARPPSSAAPGPQQAGDTRPAAEARPVTEALKALQARQAAQH